MKVTKTGNLHWIEESDTQKLFLLWNWKRKKRTQENIVEWWKKIYKKEKRNMILIFWMEMAQGLEVEWLVVENKLVAKN